MTEGCFISNTNNFLISLMPGEVLFKKGVPADSFYFVVTGKLIIVEPFTANIVREYCKDELLGIPEVFMEEKWKFMAEAKTFSSIRVFHKSILFERVEQLSSEPKKVVNYLLGRA